MNIFDIIGPVMVGPSSSHTAGAVKIGRVTRALLGERLIEVTIMLHGSFARTYKGHGTDKAIIGGLMGMTPDDLKIRDSLDIAKQQGIIYRFETVDLKDAHPNTALIEAAGSTGKRVKVLGSSVGGGNIVIKQINDMDVEFTGQYDTLIIPHKDAPGVIAAVTNLLGHRDINIAHMNVFRSHRGKNAVMIIETDQRVSEELKIVISSLSWVSGVTAIEPI